MRDKFFCLGRKWLSCVVFTALFYGFLQFFYMKHVNFNISYEGDWTADRFDVFLMKINSVTISDFYLETLSGMTQRTVMASSRPKGMKKFSRNSYYFILA